MLSRKTYELESRSDMTLTSSQMHKIESDFSLIFPGPVVLTDTLPASVDVTTAIPVPPSKIPLLKLWVKLSCQQLLFKLGRKRESRHTVIAVYPDLVNPYLMQQTSGRARHYAQDQIVIEKQSFPRNVVSKICWLVLGFGPSVGGFVLLPAERK